MKANQLLQAIQNAQLTEAELLTLNKLVVAKIKAQRSVRATVVKTGLKPGMRVGINHPQFKNQTVMIVKVNIKKAVVEAQNGQWYDVPFTLIVA